MSLESLSESLAYQEGYHAGFQTGYQKGHTEGLKLAQAFIALKPGNTITIQCPDEASAIEVIESMKSVAQAAK